MNSRPLVTVFEFENNKRLCDIADAKWKKKGLTPEEYVAVKRSLGETIVNTIFQSDILRGQIEVKVINILEGQNIPALSDIPGDAFVFGGFPGANKTKNKGMILDIKNIVYDIINRRQKPFLGICFGHQLLAQAFGGKIGVMNRGIVGPRYFVLNDNGLKDSIFRQLCSSRIGSICWHKRRVEGVGNWKEIETLGGNADGKHQIIRVGDKAWGIQGHPDFDIPGTIGRVKLSDENKFSKEGNNSKDIIKELENPLFCNRSSGTIGAFLNETVK